MVKYNDDKIKKAILLLCFVQNMDIEILQKKLNDDDKFKCSFENAIKYIDTFTNDETRIISELILRECIEELK